jgi:hypothetical protein
VATITFKYEMGDVVKDRISGFKGTVIGQYVYNTGCKHYGVAPLKVSNEGKILETENLDETRLILIKAVPKKDLSKDAKRKIVGGPALPMKGNLK